MGYVGNQTTNSYTSLDKQTITGNGGTSYTLDHAVANVNEIEVFVNNVRQEPSVAYTVSGTALTMTGNVEASDDFYVVFQGKAIQTVVPPLDSITTAMINDDAVTKAKLGTTEFDVATIKDSTGTNTAMTITADGEVLKPKNPAFYANKSATHSTNNTDIVFDTVRTNVGSHYSGTNGKFTAPEDGLYFFSFGSLINTPNTSSYAQMRLALNGTGQSKYMTHTSYNSTRNYEPVSWSGVVDLDAGDEVTVWGYFAGSANTYGGSSYTYFSGYLIG